MTAIAERGQVRGVEPRAAHLDGHDVVNHLRRHRLPPPKALPAERLLLEMRQPASPPPPGHIERTSLGIMLLDSPRFLAPRRAPMLLAESVATSNESRTSLVTTRARWFERHGSG